MFVENIMTENVFCVLPTTTIKELRDLFSNESFHHLLVAQDSKLLGVISDRDVIGILSPFIDTTDTSKRDQALLERTAEEIILTWKDMLKYYVYAT